jgi:trehalose synthase
VTRADASDLWWKNAIIYCLDVETFLDWNGDGIGDLNGVVERIDYLAGIGISCLWLMPFQPSPNRDDGYDVVDYYAVDNRLGTLGDFVVLLRTAKDRGMRVIIDLVVNHTSDKHPWFKSARRSPRSPHRDFYVWRDQPPKTNTSAKVVFPDAEDSIWSWDEQAGQWYLHHFYRHQPELNISNRAVQEEIERIIGFWLELGVDGFRVDAVPFLVGESRNEVDPHVLLRELRAFLSRRRGDALLLGEVNLPPKDLCRYFGEHPGDELQMLFDFPVMQATYLSLARGDARPLRAALEAEPEIPRECQWARFLRNHDELTLDQLSERERDEVFAAFGPDPGMQLFGRGLRRRFPPMVQGDQRRIRLAYSLLLSLPGTPVVFYGEEIGMGENLAIEGRMSVRTPMQWTPQRNGGFSPAPPSRVIRPLPEGPFGPLAVNVADQRGDPNSLLNWFEGMIRRRRETAELGMGRLSVLDPGNNAVLAHRVDDGPIEIIVLHNLAGEPNEITVGLGKGHDRCELTDLLDMGREAVTNHIDKRGRLALTLDAYDYRWFRLQPSDQPTAP